ncbi:hypothetical protein HYW44_04620 [Candidatus Daviesbacteria bacterium]|nr:hypothetical protein [Candidatus Daviesbacteria bacterium]
MDRKKIVLIAVVVSLVIILISIILRVFVFTGSNGPFKSLPSLENSQTATESGITGSDQAQSLPVSYNQPAVRGAIVRYIFEIKLKEIKGSFPVLELTPEVEITDGPKFVTNKNTLYFTEKLDKRTPATTPSLKPGQKVKIAIYYDFFRKSWTLTGVSVVQP